MTVLRVVAALGGVLVLLPVAGCSAPPALAPVDGRPGWREAPVPWERVDKSRAAEATAAFGEVAGRYVKVQSYRDRGTVIATWHGREPFSVVSRFETLLLRGGGFRFRFWSENGKLETSVWTDGKTVELWSYGNAAPAGSLEGALAEIRGISSLTSVLVPSILFGRPFFGCAPAFVGWSDIGCGKCMIVDFGKEQERRTTQMMFWLDTENMLIRRVRLIDLQQTKGNEGWWDTNIVYEPEVEPHDANAIAREIESPP